MTDVSHQPPSTPKAQSSPLAVASLVVGVLAFALPCATFFGVALLFERALMDTFGQPMSSMIVTVPALILWLLGPLAVVLGVLAVRSSRGPGTTSPPAAVIAVVLGALSIPCVLLPLLGYILFSAACVQGC
ncbi:MAG: hypothetical protein RMN53_17535 [Anaerolineae bacterium]|nr:hypothetical protein [Anaerolineae bacterium]